MKRLLRISLFLQILLILVTGCSLDNDQPPATAEVIPVDFLSEAKYSKMIVEILYINGFKPSTAAVANLQTFLEQRLNKSGGITIIANGIPSQVKATYSPNELISVEYLYRSQQTRTGTVTLFIFFADADWYANTADLKSFEATMSSSSLVVFEKTLLSYAGNAGQPTIANLESAVLIHSIGHILGLVAGGTSMVTPHMDGANPYHCDDTLCAMYVDFENNNGAARVLSTGIPALTDECLQDLKANGGK